MIIEEKAYLNSHLVEIKKNHNSTPRSKTNEAVLNRYHGDHAIFAPVL